MTVMVVGKLCALAVAVLILAIAVRDHLDEELLDMLVGGQSPGLERILRMIGYLLLIAACLALVVMRW